MTGSDEELEVTSPPSAPSVAQNNTTAKSSGQYRLLMAPAPHPDRSDKLTLTLHGPKSDDCSRLLKVLMHLTGGEEWDGPVPNFEFIVTRTPVEA